MYVLCVYVCIAYCVCWLVYLKSIVFEPFDCAAHSVRLTAKMRIRSILLVELIDAKSIDSELERIIQVIKGNHLGSEHMMVIILRFCSQELSSGKFNQLVTHVMQYEITN